MVSAIPTTVDFQIVHKFQLDVAITAKIWGDGGREKGRKVGIKMKLEIHLFQVVLLHRGGNSAADFRNMSLFLGSNFCRAEIRLLFNRELLCRRSQHRSQ